jgi:NAD(P)-dependent dehydrogenase (short-subunit alcohol dehydrogenase family)
MRALGWMRPGRWPSRCCPLADQTVAQFGRLDIAVNSAGTEGQFGPITDQTAESYAATFDTNVLGVILSMKHEVRVMREQGSGSIVNISSTYGHEGAAGASVYVGSKHAIEGITKSVALETAKSGIRVNAVDTHHLAEPHGSEVVLEPFPGGRWFERAADGTETDWGTVLAWQPPYRLLLTWQVSARWTFEEDPGRGSQIEVTFTPEGADTRVDLTHRHLERYGPEAERMRRILDGKGGEPLAAFARYIAAQAPVR